MKLTLISPEVKNRCIAIIQALPLTPVMEITIKEHKKDRSAAQNGLYFIWMGQIAAFTGESKEEAHCRMKKNHLINIYCKDPDSEMAQTVADIRTVYTNGDKEMAKRLEKSVLKLVSITSAVTSQFAEYLEDIEKECIGQGIYLSHPEDMWNEAMGIR